MPVLLLLASGQIRNACDQWRVIHSALAQRRATKQTEGDATTQRPSASRGGLLDSVREFGTTFYHLLM